MENDKIVDRIKKYLEIIGISASAFAKQIGFNQSNLSKILRGDRDVPSNLIEAISEKTQINRQWLLYGQGSMLTDGSQVQGSAPKISLPPDFLVSNAAPTEPEDIEDIEYAGENSNDGIFFRDRNSGKLYISVPHVPYAARGEFPNPGDRLDPMGEWGREIYEVDRKANGRYISFDVRGDSMDNGMRRCLQDGDKVLVRELELDYWRTLRAGDHRYWVLVFSSSVLIKEISSFDPTTGIITCHSLNPSPEYQDFTLSLDDVRNLYYVIRTKPHDDIYT